LRPTLKYSIAILFFISSVCSAQDKGPKPSKDAVKSKREIKKEERKEAKERRKREKEERKAIKAYHKRLQTKQVYKRMKKSRKKATFYNEHKREFFLIRWFKKKK
jgi:hypothetical protein